MGFLRRSLDIGLAVPRVATPDDITAISRLLRDNAHRFFSAPHEDLPALLASAPATLLQANGSIWGVAIAGWASDDIAWMRALGLADGLAVSDGLALLLPPLHAQLRQRNLRTLYYAGDAGSDRWTQSALQRCRYVRDTEVIVFEKHGLDIPAYGNWSVRVRRAQPVDLPALLAIDRVCFTAQWRKDEGIIGPSVAEVPLFIVAEVGGETIGYAFATKHFGGRLIHLVRIAVHPSHQGQAIGVRLLSEVIAFGRTSGAETLTLNTQVDNYNAHRLYEWFGFQRTGERQTVLRFDL